MSTAALTTGPRIVIGVMAYNEAGSIEAALEAILAQELGAATLVEVTVVSSGSTDGTDEIVRGIARRDERVALVTEPDRRGKISAVNTFLARHPGCDRYLLCNADVLLEPGAIHALLAPLEDDGVGITGVRVVPRTRAGPGRRFIDFANDLAWEVHHRLALEAPKMGEAVAFRAIVERIPEAAIADEAYLEARACARGLRIVYVPEARVRAGVPHTLREYFEVRRRNTCAHELLRRRSGYAVSTRGVLRLAPLLADAARAIPEARGSRGLVWTLAAVALESVARVRGRIDARLAPSRHVRWRIAHSARGPRPDMRRAGAHRSD